MDTNKRVNPLETETRPWGTWEVLLDETYCKVKRITVKPGHRTSYQKHFKRQEQWMVVVGEATVTLNDELITLKTGDTLAVPEEASHRIANRGDIPMVFIEVQRGTYFGEDDIIRFEDDYGRV